MLKTKVKVGKVTNLSDARYCAGMGVDLLGFPLGPGPTTLDPKKYKEITSWISGPRIVIEWYGDALPTDFQELIEQYNEPTFEFDVALIGNIPALLESFLLRVDIRDWKLTQHDIRANKARISYLVLTSRDAQAVDPVAVAEIGKEFPVLLGFGISESNLDRLMQLPIAGISLEGADESKPGLKDYAHLSEILEHLEVMEE